MILSFCSAAGVDTLERVQRSEQGVNGSTLPWYCSSISCRRPCVKAQQEKILRWLCSADPVVNHSNACSKRKPATGNSSMQSQELAIWWKDENQFLWLYGISDVIRQCSSDCH